MGLLQLLTAVGAVQITHPVVDYKRYLSNEADCHSEGVFEFIFFLLQYYGVLCVDGQI